MNLPFKFARRYIFSPKSTNAINIISAISVIGIAIGSMALIIIMSVFNGFEGLLGTLIGNFKPDVKITAVEGKVFVSDTSKIAKIKSIDGVLAVSKTLEEIALFEYEGVQNIAILKGVDHFYNKVLTIDTCITEGKYNIYDSLNHVHYTVVGATLAHTINIVVGNAFNRPITVYMPKRLGKVSTNPSKKPFKQKQFFPAGVYAIQQSEYDNYAITNLAFAQELTSYENGEISALEIKLKPNSNQEQILQQITEIMGKEYLVQNRYQQDEALYKITNLEKYVAFLIFAFTLVLVAFNMVGALWMLVLEKKKDISTLKSMGATSQLIQQIFLAEGFLMSFIGLALGCIAAIILCWLQQTYGLVQLSSSGGSDFIQVIITVLFIGTAAAWIPARQAGEITNILREKE